MAGTRRPIIGVTGRRVRSDSGVEVVTVKDAYLAEVVAAGGVPVVLAPTPEPGAIARLAESIDGLLLTGGRDIDPQRYGERIWNATVQPEPDRDAFELPLVRLAVEADRPVLAICRGIQVLNVALGGTLYQDLPTQLPESLLHTQEEDRDAVTHSVRMEPHSCLARLIGDAPLETNTFHHQAVKDVASSLQVTARSDDGVIEALEAPDRRFVCGVQWHPEDLAASYPRHRRLFEALVGAAGPARETTEQAGDRAAVIRSDRGAPPPGAR